MRNLSRIIFINSANIPYSDDIYLDGNVHFIGTQGVGKITFCVLSFSLQCRHATAGHFGGKAELHGLLFSPTQFVYRLRSGNRERRVLYSEFQIDEPCMLPLHPLSLTAKNSL